MDDQRTDRLAIRDLVENWALWRDAGDWARFRTVWHDDGRMMATWFQGTADAFIGVSRAIAQTKMTINQRAEVDRVLCDVVCTGRFYDFLEKREGRWGLVLRQPIYEKDRLDPVAPDARLTLDPDLLGRFPEGYRHLAYLQTRIGYTVKADMPGLIGRRSRRYTRAGRAGWPAAHCRRWRPTSRRHQNGCHTQLGVPA